MNNYTTVFNIGLGSTFVCYITFFLTGRKYVLGLACFLTFVTIFMPVLLDRGQTAKKTVSGEQ